MGDRWMHITFRGDHTTVHVHNRGKHREYLPGHKRLTWLVDWIRGTDKESSKEISPWYINGVFELEVYL